MGLDSVEIVIMAEESFGICISDEDAQRMRTVGEFVDLICKQVIAKPEEECIAHRLFFKLRRGFRKHIAALVPDFNLDLPLKKVVHKDQWPIVWTAIRKDVGSPDWPETIPFPGILRDGLKNISELIWYIVWALPKPAPNKWTKLSVEAEVRRIINNVVGERTYSLSAEFVKDLGVQ